MVNLNTLSASDLVRVTGVLLGVVVFVYVLNTVYKHSESYEGTVIERDCLSDGPGGYTGCFILVEADDGATERAEVHASCGWFSVGDYVVKRRGSRCPKVGRKGKDVKVPSPRRNPDLSRQLEDFDRTK